MKRIVLLLLAVFVCSFLLFTNNHHKYQTYPNHISDAGLMQDTLRVKQLTLPKDSTIHKSITKKGKSEKHPLKGRLKLTKRKSVKSREFGGVFMDESLMYRTR